MWVDGPDGAWEIYAVLADSDDFGQSSAKVDDQTGRLAVLRVGPGGRGPLLLMAPTHAQRAPIDSPAVWHAADLAEHLGLDDRAHRRPARRDRFGRTRRSRQRSHHRNAGARRRAAARAARTSSARSCGSSPRATGSCSCVASRSTCSMTLETELAYFALGLHLGTPVSQDAAGTLLGHVRDERVERTGPEVRLYRTRQRQDFHTDGADIIGLLCLQAARSGGESRLASSYAVYNEILRRRPDLLDVLYEPMWWDRNGEESPGEDRAFPLPVLHDVDGTPRVFYIGWYIRDAQRHPEVPRLTETQPEALDLIETIANDPAFHVEMDFQPGDVQLLNNAKILHSREAYEDHEALDERRHLLRLWLSAHDFTSVESQLRSRDPGPAELTAPATDIS